MAILQHDCAAFEDVQNAFSRAYEVFRGQHGRVFVESKKVLERVNSLTSIDENIAKSAAWVFGADVAFMYNVRNDNDDNLGRSEIYMIERGRHAVSCDLSVPSMLPEERVKIGYYPLQLDNFGLKGAYHQHNNTVLLGLLKDSSTEEGWQWLLACQRKRAEESSSQGTIEREGVWPCYGKLSDELLHEVSKFLPIPIKKILPVRSTRMQTFLALSSRVSN
jgi:hypothetical protein